jgi:hypothetical protein
MSKEVAVDICPELSTLWDTGDVRVISTADAPCGSHAFQHNFQLFIAQRCALCRKCLVSLVSPYRHSLLVAVIPLNHWSALNTSTNLMYPQRQKKIQMIKVRGSCRPVGWASASYPLFTERLVQVLCDNAKKMNWCPIMHEPQILSSMKIYKFQEYRQIIRQTQWYTARVSLSGKTTGLKSCSPAMSTQTLTENRCWCLDAIVVCGLSSTLTWVLWNFTVPSLANPTSSVKRVLATNYMFTTHFVSSHWQNTTLARWPGGVGPCIRWMWYG